MSKRSKYRPSTFTCPVTIGGVRYTYYFNLDMDKDRAIVKYLQHKNEDEGKYYSFGAQWWGFHKSNGYYEIVRACIKNENGMYLGNLAYNLIHVMQFATSNEMMRIATNAINEAAQTKQLKELSEKANAESAKEASEGVVEPSTAGDKPKRKRTSKKKSDDND